MGWVGQYLGMDNTNFTPHPNERRMGGPRHSKWSHLPDGPWKFIGSESRTFQACPGAPLQVGGSCDHCGTGITDTYIFAAPTGERFKVGSTCVYKMIKQGKTDNDVPAALQKAGDAIRHARNKASRIRAKAKRVTQRAAAVELLDQHRAAADAIPHPNKWRADKGDTLADWAAWMLHNGGGPASVQVAERLQKLGTAAA